MDIANETPFPATTMLWEDIEGNARLSIIVKATFSINKKGPIVSGEQWPIFNADHHHNDDPLAPVRFETDMAPFKPRADIVLVGRAYAPDGLPITRVDVAMRVGSLQRVIRVIGDRVWSYSNKSGGLATFTTPKPFKTMDLVYERAFGGIDAAAARYCKENPIGRGFIGRKAVDSIDGKLLPNLEDPHNMVFSVDSQPKPVGFGFYGRGWSPRLRYAGTYDDKYQKERAPALPLDFSYELFNGAHPGFQLSGYLRGDEEVELVHLTPEPVLRFRLPGLRPLIRIRRWTEDPLEWLEQNSGGQQLRTIEQAPTTKQPVETFLDTLVLVPDEGIFYEVFRAVAPLVSLDSIDIARVKIAS